MLRSKAEIEAQVPPMGTEKASLPQIRRQVERICESVDVDYDDIAELRISHDLIHVIEYLRNSEGEFYRDESGRLARTMRTLPVDTTTLLGDERDI